MDYLGLARNPERVFVAILLGFVAQIHEAVSGLLYSPSPIDGNLAPGEIRFAAAPPRQAQRPGSASNGRAAQMALGEPLTSMWTSVWT